MAYNQAAGKIGIRPLMPLAEASALIGRHSEPQIQPHEPLADLAALKLLAEHCERFSPLVGWETVGGWNDRRQKSVDSEQSGPNCLLLDVTGIGVLFGGEERLARLVVNDFARRSYIGRVAIASTVGAAWGLANLGCDGCYAEKEELSAFYALPLSALRLPRNTLSLLNQLGIERIEQLAALPRDGLSARLGPGPLWRLDQMLGTTAETIVAYRPPPQFFADRALEYPAEKKQAIEHVILALLKSLSRTLAERKTGAVQLQLRLDCVPGEPVVLKVNLFQPSANAAHLADLVRMHLDQSRLPGPVGRIQLAATRTASLVSRQRELFAGSAQEAPRHLAALLDRLSSRLGADAVLRPELVADPLPERSVRYQRLVHGSAKVQRSRATTFAPWERALTLISPPLALEVVSVVPDGPPIVFCRQGKQVRTARHWGPERVETGWWRGPSVRRDYYRVETLEGERLWLFRSLDDGRWFLHGEFS